MDYTNLAIESPHCLTYLERIKEKPFKKIALVTQPPDTYDKPIAEFRKVADVIQIPTLLTTNEMLQEFYAYFHMQYESPTDILEKLSDYDYYREFSAKHAEYVFMKMAGIEIYKNTIYHVPAQPIQYNNYFDQVIVLTNNGIDEHELRKHAEEEGFEYETELALIKTQRKYFEECRTLIASA